MFHKKTKHINVMYHFVCKIIACGDIIVSEVRNLRCVHMMNKLLPIAKFVYYSNLVGLGYSVLPYET